jgi:hypothetical protein
MGDAFTKEDIVEEIDGRRERELITAASAAYLNKALEPTPYSLRLAPAFGRGSPRALALSHFNEGSHYY